jgi:hypothetical protein
MMPIKTSGETNNWSSHPVRGLKKEEESKGKNIHNTCIPVLQHSFPSPAKCQGCRGSEPPAALW